MRYGIHLAPFGPLADAWALSDLAVRAEQRGFDGFFIWDHVLRPEVGLPMADALTALAAVAVRTERLVFGPMVTPVARRRPQILARQAVTLDQLSRGRFVLGVGLGVNTGGELTRFGEEDDQARRSDRLDEGLDLLTELWSGEEVRHDGRYFRADAVTFLPRPVDGLVPVWVAAQAPVARAMRRAARYQGLCPEASIEEVGIMLEMVRSYRGSLDGFEVVICREPGEDHRPWERAGATWWLLHVPPDMPVREIEALVDAGLP